VTVNVKINRKVKIRTDAIYTIGSSGLLGDRNVLISPHEYAAGTPEADKAPYVEPGATLHGSAAPSIDTLAAAAQPLIIKANAIADQLNDMIVKLNKDVLSGTSTEDIKQSIVEFRELVKKANTMASSGDAMLKNANDVLVDVKESKGPLGLARISRFSARTSRSTASFSIKTTAPRPTRKSSPHERIP
jgi:phospholipid/cholesterol/gamma-HCH transport system substrate-binding protein